MATASEVDSEPKLDILSEDAVMIKLSLIKDALAAKEQESSSSEGPGIKGQIFLLWHTLACFCLICPETDQVMVSQHHRLVAQYVG